MLKKSKTYAFTLVELMVVIVIIGLVASLTIPTINKSINNSKKNLYDLQIKNIEDGAKSWASANIWLLPANDGEAITITLGQLKLEGFVDGDVINPKTEKSFPNDLEIIIKKESGNYIYDVDEESGTAISDSTVSKPTIILLGEPVVNVEINTGYIEPGVIAKNIDGSTNESVNITIKKDGETVTSIESTAIAHYEITYSVTDNGTISNAIRNVYIRDTTPPELTIPSDATISVSAVNGYDLMTGVTTSDNSGLEPSITISSNLSAIKGDYTVTYKALDMSGNQTVKVRKITVTD